MVVAILAATFLALLDPDEAPPDQCSVMVVSVQVGPSIGSFGS